MYDASAAVEPLSDISISGSNVLGDKAYGSLEIRNYVTEQKATYTISPKENTAEPWLCDFTLYKERHLAACFINKLKAFRRIATCYDKLTVSFFAFIHLSAICSLLSDTSDTILGIFQIGPNSST